MRWPSRKMSAVAILMGAAVALAAGCADQKAKAQKLIQDKVAECRQAEPDGVWYEVELFDDATEKVLWETCREEITDFEMTSEFGARAKTGPTVWTVGVDEELGVWVPIDAGWETLDSAMGAIGEDDPSEESLRYAEEQLAKAQQEYPSSAWLRLRRLENLLDLRAKTRKSSADDASKLGETAEAYYTETLEWAEANDKLDAKVEAQYLVADHLRDYIAHLDLAMESFGAMDDHLLKSIEEAEKQGESDEADKYRKELEERTAKREAEKAMLEERQRQTKEHLCMRLAELSPAGVGDQTLQKKVVAIKETTNCMARAADETGDADQ